MKIKKFKNGNLNLSIDQYDLSERGDLDIESLYTQDFYKNDLYIEQINGSECLRDRSNKNIYDLSKNLDALSVLQYEVVQCFTEGKVLKLERRRVCHIQEY